MKTLLISLLIGAAALPGSASARKTGFQLKDVAVERTENNLYINGTVPVERVGGSNREVWVTPVIRNGNDSIELGTTVVAGRNRYYQALRHDLAKSEGVALVRDSRELQSLPVRAQLPFEKWMSTAEMHVRYDVKGCCSDSLDRRIVPLGQLDLEPKRFVPSFNWLEPAAEVKMRELKGQAFIDFPVNKTEIYPDYRGNQRELAKIRATIDSVINDRDVEITALSIKGFASPEGSWRNNERLAKGRTAALKSYVEQLYHFSPGFITASYEPEDWEGLVKWLQGNDIDHRDAILAIATDNSLAPDARDARIKRRFPAQYARLLADVYPALRHSDYRIEYRIRPFTDPAQIVEIARTRPQNLSLQEFFLAARSLEPGSEAYNELFETAVRMYPHSEVANLNAANAAMMRGDLAGARRYLDKAGDGPEAVYARGVWEALGGNYDAARSSFERAARLKVADAPAALEQLKELE